MDIKTTNPEPQSVPPAGTSAVPSGDTKAEKAPVRRYLRDPRLRLTVVVLLLAAAGLIAAGLLSTRNQLHGVCTEPQNISIVQQAAMAIPVDSKHRLPGLAKKVQQLNGYRQDPNCLAVLFYESLDRADVGQAQSYLNLIKKNNPGPDGFSQYFGKMSVNSLQAALDDTNKALDQASNNSFGVSHP